VFKIEPNKNLHHGGAKLVKLNIPNGFGRDNKTRGNRRKLDMELANEHCYDINESINKFLNDVEVAKSFHEMPTPLFPLPFYNEKSKGNGSVPISGKLYHYTSAESLLAIIENAKESKNFNLHLSRIDYVNDPSEGGSIFNRVCKEYLSNEDYYSLLSPIIQQGFEIKTGYVCSMSADKDSLPLWQCYANKGVGYNIMFDAKALYMACNEKNILLLPVIYDHKFMCNIMKPTFKKLCSFRNRAKGKDLDDILNKISEFISFAKLAFKHPSYSYEREIRIATIINVKDAPDTEKYKQQNGIFKPYIEISLPKSIFGGVTVGPLVEAEIAKCTVEDALKAYNFGDMVARNVDISKAPIRFL
jgi:hypothetical protein